MQRILIIDDEVIAREVVRRVLEREGYEVVEAGNGQEGLELFREKPCDLLITDLVMPVKDGLKTILEIRELAPNLPIIAVSGGGTISKERYLTVAGYISDVVTLAKPFSRDLLLEEVGRLLAGKDQDPGPATGM